jgi:hypothetical protein
MKYRRVPISQSVFQFLAAGGPKMKSTRTLWSCYWALVRLWYFPIIFYVPFSNFSTHLFKIWSFLWKVLETCDLFSFSHFKKVIFALFTLQIVHYLTIIFNLIEAPSYPSSELQLQRNVHLQSRRGFACICCWRVIKNSYLFISY